MRVVYLPSTIGDSLWLRRYYSRAFPEGAIDARDSLRRTQAILADNPLIGQPGEEPGTRELPIRRTPFSLIYRINGDRIEILRILDQRSSSPPG